MRCGAVTRAPSQRCFFNHGRTCSRTHSSKMSVLLPTVPHTRMLLISSLSAALSRGSRRSSCPIPVTRNTRRDRWNPTFAHDFCGGFVLDPLDRRSAINQRSRCLARQCGWLGFVRSIVSCELPESVISSARSHPSRRQQRPAEMPRLPLRCRQHLISKLIDKWDLGDFRAAKRSATTISIITISARPGLSMSRPPTAVALPWLGCR